MSASHLRARVGKVCAAIVADSPAAMLEKATQAARETPFLEFRLDSLPDAAAALPSLASFLAAHTEVTGLATCRRTPNGGGFGGSETLQIEVLCEAARVGFHLVDVELETAEALTAEPSTRGLLGGLRSLGPGLMVSWHDFHQTPDLDAVFARMQPFAPDFYKLVPTAETLGDNLRLLHFVERASDTASIVGICMGEPGALSRVLGLRAGSSFTFAAAVPGEATGPGQMAARTLLEDFRIEDVDASTKVFGVAGNPVAKSLSPLMLNAAFRRETVNALFLPLPTADVSDLVEAIRGVPLAGVSITMPHKESILKHLDHVDPLTARVGACNTVLRVAGARGADGRSERAQLYGFNTDVSGVVAPLEKRMALRSAKILVLGAGGAARAAVFGLRERGAEVHVLNRTPARAAALARESGAKVAKRDALARTAWDAIVNATSVGMAGQPEPELLSGADFVGGLRARFLFDLVYNPVETQLVRTARAAGITVIPGVEMFVQQGARQFELWTGKPAPVDEMQRVVLHALRQRPEQAVEAASRSAPATSGFQQEKLSAPVEKPAETSEVAKAATAVPEEGSQLAALSKQAGATKARISRNISPAAKNVTASSVPGGNGMSAPSKDAPSKRAPSKSVRSKGAPEKARRAGH